MAAKKRAAKPLYIEKAATTPKTNVPETKHVDWRDPAATFSDDDQSLEARMWRLARR
jgi:hypothetical protein